MAFLHDHGKSEKECRPRLGDLMKFMETGSSASQPEVPRIKDPSLLVWLCAAADCWRCRVVQHSNGGAFAGAWSYYTVLQDYQGRREDQLPYSPASSHSRNQTAELPSPSALRN